MLKLATEHRAAGRPSSRAELIAVAPPRATVFKTTTACCRQWPSGLIERRNQTWIDLPFDFATRASHRAPHTHRSFPLARTVGRLPGRAHIGTERDRLA